MSRSKEMQLWEQLSDGEILAIAQPNIYYGSDVTGHAMRAFVADYQLYMAAHAVPALIDYGRVVDTGGNVYQPLFKVDDRKDIARARRALDISAETSDFSHPVIGFPQGLRIAEELPADDRVVIVTSIARPNFLHPNGSAWLNQETVIRGTIFARNGQRIYIDCSGRDQERVRSGMSSSPVLVEAKDGLRALAVLTHGPPGQRNEGSGVLITHSNLLRRIIPHLS